MAVVFGPERIEHAVGVELDSGFCEAARALWAEAGLDMVQGDFTRIVARSDRPVAPNLILTNPPYVRHHHLEREDKARLQALAQRMTGIEVNGPAGLYVYFLLLTTAWMEEGGFAAWLIPSEFMDMNYGATLKKFLTDHVELIRIHRFSAENVQFGDALVSSVVLVFRKGTPPRKHSAEITFGGTMAQPYAGKAVTLEQLRDSRKWTVYPEHARNDRRTSTNGEGPILGDLFRIQRGIATGSNKFFVLVRADAIRDGLPKKFLRPILPSPRHLKTTIIDADEDGYPLIGLRGQAAVSFYLDPLSRHWYEPLPHIVSNGVASLPNYVYNQSVAQRSTSCCDPSPVTSCAARDESMAAGSTRSNRANWAAFRQIVCRTLAGADVRRATPSGALRLSCGRIKLAANKRTQVTAFRAAADTKR